MKKTFSVICVMSALLFGLSACDNSPGVYTNVGDPERMIDVSSEVVTVSLTAKNAIMKLSSMLVQDPPLRAVLSCSFKDTRCTQAKEVFDRNNVPVKFANNNKNTVTLYYDRVAVRDCDPRYVDNSINNRNTTHSSFGCASVGNMLQMVSDKRQFTNPSLMDFPDAEKASQSYNRYLKPAAADARAIDKPGIESAVDKQSQ